MQNREPAELSDAELVTRFETGRDRYAFSEIVRRYGAMVRNSANRILHNPDDADDACQAAFMALANALARESLRDKQALAAWLDTTAQRCAKTLLRAKTRRSQSIKKAVEMNTERTSNTDIVADPAIQLEHAERRIAVTKSLSQLSADDRSVLLLCDMEGLSRIEASKRLEIPASTVTKRLMKARDLLRRQLARQGIVASGSGIAALIASNADSSLEAAMIEEVTAKSLLFASGKTASQIGVSSVVFETAASIVTRLIKMKPLLIGGMFVLAALISAGIASIIIVKPDRHPMSVPGTRFIDDFTDGNLADDSPVSWRSEFLPGEINATSDGLVIGPNASSHSTGDVATEVTKIRLRDVSIRTRMSVTEIGGSAILNARIRVGDDGLPTAGYFAGVGFIPEFGGSIVLAGRLDGFMKRTFFPAPEGTPVFALPYDVRQEDTVVQMDLFGDTVRIWVWQAEGGSKPVEPQFEVEDGTHMHAGIIGTYVANTGSAQGTGTSSAIFRYIHVAEVPIP